MSLVSNLRPRLRLLRLALTRRYFWADLAAMVKSEGYEVREIRANVHPLRFASFLPKTVGPVPNFSGLGPGDAFALAGTHAWNSEPSVSTFLGELAFRQRPQTVVELGCYVGWTSAHIALGLRAAGDQGRLWCVDTERRFLDAAAENLRQHDLIHRVSFVEGFSTDGQVLAALPSSIDLLFIDTSHEYRPTLAEIEIYLPRLAPGGLIALHDSISQDGVRRAIFDRWSEFETLTFATEAGNGVTVLRVRQP